MLNKHNVVTFTNFCMFSHYSIIYRLRLSMLVLMAMMKLWQVNLVFLTVYDI